MTFLHCFVAQLNNRMYQASDSRPPQYSPHNKQLFPLKDLTCLLCNHDLKTFLNVYSRKKALRQDGIKSVIALSQYDLDKVPLDLKTHKSLLKSNKDYDLIPEHAQFHEEVKPDKITKTKAPIDKREIKSSAPIEIMKVDGNSNSEKIKKKGWWST